MVEQRGDKWVVVHGHPQKKRSKRDKPKGTVIAEHSTKEAALRQHRAIMASEARKGNV